jgi:DNA-binding MarR family transcriptional regulator/GNAT superfamily N-acetyltransferase
MLDNINYIVARVNYRDTTMSSIDAATVRLRQFNRFYTRHLGLLNAGLLQSRLTLPEVRVLYELAQRAQPTAAEIGRLLLMDEGYLSRLLRKLRHQGLVRARPAADDGRQRWLTLTSKGQKAFQTLDARATADVESLIRHLPPEEIQQLLDAVNRVEALLEGSLVAPPAAETEGANLRAPAPGDLGWVVQRHGELYFREYGWDEDFERLVARIVGEYAAAPIGPRQRCWIATVDGRRAGCVFLMPGGRAEEARLRLLLVETWARGQRLGSRLVAACIDAARQAGCARLTLWTNDVLSAARHIYERAGFQLVQSEPHKSFGKTLVGQNWELTL